MIRHKKLNLVFVLLILLAVLYRLRAACPYLGTGSKIKISNQVKDTLKRQAESPIVNGNVREGSFSMR